jgi:hypothetical protein
MGRERVVKMKFTHWFTDKFQVFTEKSPRSLDYPETQINQQQQDRKKKSSWGGARPNSGGPRPNSGGPRPDSGGKREGTGRKYKFYPAIKINYDPGENRESILKAMLDLYTWLLADEIEARKAATAIHILESIAEIRIPSEWEEDLNELKAEAKRLRDAIRSKK